MEEELQEPQDKPVEIAAATMHGDLMALVFDELKAAPDVWQKLGEREQGDVIDRVRRRTGEAIEECVRLIATEGFTRIKAKVDSITVKDGIKAVLSVSQHDTARHDLVDAQGAVVYIVLANADAFTGGTEAIKPEPDQGALVLNALDRLGKGDNAQPAQPGEDAGTPPQGDAGKDSDAGAADEPEGDKQ